MPVTWVDGVTPVNAANMEILDTDIAARQVTTEKGAANGYAPLDSGAKVPLVNLPPVSGVDYIGTWGSGIAYKKGDVVRYGSNDYMAVNDSTGVTPPAAALPTITPGVAYGTTLPSTGLYDGMEAILVDSLTNPSYTWRFRYNAGSTSAYKWEFVGGADWYAFQSGGWGTAFGSTAWTLASPPMTFTVPRAGDYLMTHGYQGGGPAGESSFIQGSAAKDGVATPVSVYPQVAASYGINLMINLSVSGRVPAVASSVSALYQSANPNSFVGNRWMRVQPVRVA